MLSNQLIFKLKLLCCVHKKKKKKKKKKKITVKWKIPGTEFFVQIPT